MDKKMIFVFFSIQLCFRRDVCFLIDYRSNSIVLVGYRLFLIIAVDCYFYIYIYIYILFQFLKVVQPNQ